ncbi:MAG: tRNA pseudouridine(38-40) synthase TruA, partial [Candidatus Omnitrophica bacterium CG12_big_fil_rev_8_21_14_0_65_50_5]
KDADVIVIDIEGDGFLYKMVRNIIGVVTRVGSGMIPQGSLWEILQKKDKALVKYTAAAHGLALLEVKY